MEQHAIPQQISSYQFRLVGDMTLKQFFQLAGGFVVALIFYSAPLIGIIKWPFVIISAILGVALAFLPLEERPLERWIFAFFRAIYAPTEYFWKKTATPPKYYMDEPAAQPAAAPALTQYLSGTTQKTAATSKLEGAEQGFLATLTGIVSGLVTQATGGPVSTTTIPVGTQLPATPQAHPTPPVSAEEQKQGIQIPQTPLIRIEKVAPARLMVEEKPAAPQTAAQQITTHQVAPTIAGEEIVSTKQAIFSVDAAPPNPPTFPNVVVGQVVDQNRKIVEGAIMEVRDSAGRPIRALRSNKAGHFITVTPLDTGRYDIFTEKDGYEFTPVNFDATGQIIPPILVQGRSVQAAPATVPNVTNNNIQTNVSTY